MIPTTYNNGAKTRVWLGHGKRYAWPPPNIFAGPAACFWYTRDMMHSLHSQVVHASDVCSIHAGPCVVYRRMDLMCIPGCLLAGRGLLLTAACARRRQR